MIVKKNEAVTITELLKELFNTYGFESEEYEGWVIPKGTDFAMKGYWYPTATESTGQLSIEVFINSEMIMVESFSGIGESENSKLQSAFSNFLHHAFPTLLVAIWQGDSKEVEEEQWQVGEYTYTAYIGTQGLINYDKEKKLTVPSSYTEQVKNLIASETLTNDLHWFNVFYANMNGLDSYAEVLKDNVKWIAGEKALNALDWKRSNHYYSVRQFLLLKRNS